MNIQELKTEGLKKLDELDQVVYLACYEEAKVCKCHPVDVLLEAISNCVQVPHIKLVILCRVAKRLLEDERDHHVNIRKT